jgi:hypothetical protein
VVTIFIAVLGAEGAKWWGICIEKGQAELSKEQEAVDVGRQSVVGEAARQGVQWHARSRGKEGGKDVKGIGWEVLSVLEKGFVC